MEKLTKQSKALKGRRAENDFFERLYAFMTCVLENDSDVEMPTVKAQPWQGVSGTLHSRKELLFMFVWVFATLSFLDYYFLMQHTNKQ